MSIALVTGANRGIGLATSRALAQTGACVVLTGRRLVDAEAAAASLRQEGLDVRALELDVTSSDSITAAAERVARDQGRLDILVNNAGVLPEATDATEHHFANPDLVRATFEVNVVGAVAVTEAFLPLLKRSAGARIVNLSTTMGSLSDQTNPASPYYGMVVPGYQSSKAALNSITIGLAKALAPTGIKVTAVCPGFVQTELTPMNKEQAPLTASQAAQVVVAAATLPEDAASGTFVDANGTVSW